MWPGRKALLCRAGSLKQASGMEIKPGLRGFSSIEQSENRVTIVLHPRGFRVPTTEGDTNFRQVLERP